MLTMKFVLSPELKNCFRFIDFYLIIFLDNGSEKKDAG